MVLHGQIEKAVRNVLKDKTTGNESHLTQLVVSDKTKPAAFRASTFFVTYLTDEKMAALFAGADPTDERITLLASELAPSNALIKTRGQVLKGWLTTEELSKLAIASDAPAQVKEVKIEKPAKPA
jgi:hypothetical protein